MAYFLVFLVALLIILVSSSDELQSQFFFKLLYKVFKSLNPPFVDFVCYKFRRTPKLL